MSTFYSDMLSEPKRSNRFLLYLGSEGSALQPFVVKSVDKPKYSVGTVEHKFGQHRFRWPSSVTWEDVNVTLIDPAGDSVSASTLAELTNILVKSGYVPPTSYDNALSFMTKAKSVTALGIPRIVQLDADANQIEEWRLHNAFITNATFGTLDYNSDEIVSISLTLSYDFATLDGTNPASNLK